MKNDDFFHSYSLREIRIYIIYESVYLHNVIFLSRVKVAKFLNKLKVAARYSFSLSDSTASMRLVKLNVSILQATCYLAVRESYGAIPNLLVEFQLEEFLLFERNPRLPITFVLDHVQQLPILAGLRSFSCSSARVFLAISRVLHLVHSRDL